MRVEAAPGTSQEQMGGRLAGFRPLGALTQEMPDPVSEQRAFPDGQERQDFYTDKTAHE